MTTLAQIATQVAQLGPGVDRVIAERDRAQLKLHGAETALLLIKATTTDEKTRAVAEAALEILEAP